MSSSNISLLVLQHLYTVMHPLLLYVVANTAGNIHRNRVSAHVVQLLMVKGLQHPTTNIVPLNTLDLIITYNVLNLESLLCTGFWGLTTTIYSQ